MPPVKELLVNGARRPTDADTRRTLLSVLRDDLDLTGCKYGCGEGRCGSCTVLVDGRPTRSCTTPAGAARGKRIETIEGLAKDGKLHPLQQAFLDAGALQCGYCTPGMILSALALLRKEAKPSRDEIATHLSGHICRCGVYTRILDAVERAARMMKEGDR